MSTPKQERSMLELNLARTYLSNAAAHGGSYPQPLLLQPHAKGPNSLLSSIVASG